MIMIDRRETDIVSSFSPYGDCHVDSTNELEFGDYFFMGNGPAGEGTLTIGIERKKIRDLISCMRERRLAGLQAPGMATAYDIRYLVVEGIWQCGPTGALEELRGRDWRPVSGRKGQPVLWRELDSFIASLEEFFGFRQKQTKNMKETVAYIVSRYKYWQKPYDQHQTHKQVYAPTPDKGIGKKASFISMEDEIRRMYGPNAVFTWKMAAQLPGIDRRAELVARAFPQPEDMFRATRSDWIRAGIGPKTTDRIREILHGLD